MADRDFTREGSGICVDDVAVSGRRLVVIAEPGAIAGGQLGGDPGDMEDHVRQKRAIRLSQAQVTIVGLGLMGASLGLALREAGACRRVWGVARREEALAQAVATRAVEGGTTVLARGVQEADIVVLATPVRAILALIPQVGPLLPAGTLLMDLGSTKADVASAMAGLPEQVDALGGHPMCGKELSGLNAAQAQLYRGQSFVLTPLERTSPQALALARELVEAVGARPVIMEPARHDWLVTATSHLPYLLSVALVEAVVQVAAGDELAWKLVASGFRDTSRLAASDTTVMLDTLLTNRANVAALSRRTAERLSELAALMEAGDEAALRPVLERAREARRTNVS